MLDTRRKANLTQAYCLLKRVFQGNYDRDITDVYYNTQYVDSVHKGENRSIMGSKQEKCKYMVWWLFGNKPDLI
jgi:hypothetical protein